MAIFLIMCGLCQPVLGQSPVPEKNLLGDPLPEGALARLGTTRLRHADPVTAARRITRRTASGSASFCRWEDFVAVWETKSGKLRRRLPLTGVVRMAFSPDGTTLAIIRATSTFTGEILVECWDIAGGKKISRFRDEERHAEEAVLEFSPGGKLLFFGRSRLRCLDFAGDKMVYQIPFENEAHSAAVITALAISPDESTLFIAAGSPGIRIHDARTGLERCRAEGNFSVSRLASGEEGKLLAMASSTGLIELWQVPPVSGQKPGITFDKLPLSGALTGSILGLTFSPDSKSLLGLSEKGEACLWDVIANRSVHRRQLPTGSLGGTAFDSGQRPLAFTVKNGGRGLASWDVAAGMEMFSENDSGPSVTCLAYSPDGRSWLPAATTRSCAFGERPPANGLPRLSFPAIPVK